MESVCAYVCVRGCACACVCVCVCVYVYVWSAFLDGAHWTVQLVPLPSVPPVTGQPLLTVATVLAVKLAGNTDHGAVRGVCL